MSNPASAGLPRLVITLSLSVLPSCGGEEGDSPRSDAGMHDAAEVVAQDASLGCPSHSVCPAVGGFCVEGTCSAPIPCGSDKDCATLDGVCAKDLGRCVPCIENNDCKAGQLCQAYRCASPAAACQTSKDCSAADQVCDKALGACVDCAGKDDCAEGQTCYESRCVLPICGPSDKTCKDTSTARRCRADGMGYELVSCDGAQSCVDGACDGGEDAGGSDGGPTDTQSQDAGGADSGAIDSGVVDSGTPDTGTPDTSATDAGTPDTGTPDTGTPDTGTPDTGTPDTSTPDTGTPDTGTPDTGAPDTGTPDTGTPDTGTPDTGTPDTGTPDTGTPDTGTPDIGTPDTGTPDTGTPDTGTPDTGTPDTGTPDTGAPDTGTPDTGAPDTGTPDTGTPDTGTPDTGTPDTGTPDTGPTDTGPPVICKPGATQCSGTQLLTCNSSGTGWLPSSCPSGQVCKGDICAAPPCKLVESPTFTGHVYRLDTGPETKTKGLMACGAPKYGEVWVTTLHGGTIRRFGADFKDTGKTFQGPLYPRGMWGLPDGDYLATEHDKYGAYQKGTLRRFKGLSSQVVWSLKSPGGKGLLFVTEEGGTTIVSGLDSNNKITAWSVDSATGALKKNLGYKVGNFALAAVGGRVWHVGKTGMSALSFPDLFQTGVPPIATTSVPGEKLAVFTGKAICVVTKLPVSRVVCFDVYGGCGAPPNTLPFKESRLLFDSEKQQLAAWLPTEKLTTWQQCGKALNWPKQISSECQNKGASVIVFYNGQVRGAYTSEPLKFDNSTSQDAKAFLFRSEPMVQLMAKPGAVTHYHEKTYGLRWATQGARCTGVSSCSCNHAALYSSYECPAPKSTAQCMSIWPGGSSWAPKVWEVFTAKP